MEALKENKKLFIILLVVVIGSAGFLLYYFFFKPTPGGGLAESGLVMDADGFGSAGADIDAFGIDAGDAVSTNMSGELIMMLSQLQSISLENKLESEPGFSGLLDHSVQIDPREPGRDNPFAPFEGGPIMHMVVDEVPEVDENTEEEVEA